jgi:hypothetical protein
LSGVFQDRVPVLAKQCDHRRLESAIEEQIVADRASGKADLGADFLRPSVDVGNDFQRALGFSAQPLRHRLSAMIRRLDPGPLPMQPHQLGDRLGPLDRVVGAAEKVFGDFAPTGEGLVERDDPDVDRDSGEASAGHPVTACAGELPTAAGERTHVNRVDLPVALHRLADRSRPGRVDRPKPQRRVDLVGIERHNVAGLDRRDRSSRRHV